MLAVLTDQLLRQGVDEGRGRAARSRVPPCVENGGEHTRPVARRQPADEIHVGVQALPCAAPTAALAGRPAHAGALDLLAVDDPVLTGGHPVHRRLARAGDVHSLVHERPEPTRDG